MFVKRTYWLNWFTRGIWQRLPLIALFVVFSALAWDSSSLAAESASQPVPRIPSGTVIGEQVPTGWTHVINQSHSRITTGDLDSINTTIAHLASFLSSNLLARVDTHEINGQQKHRIGEIAVGLGLNVDGKETIISSETLSEQGIRLGFLEKMGLRKAEARLPKLIIVSRSDTIVVFDGVSQIVRDDQHVEMMARHVVMVDENSGELNTFMWFIDLDRSGRYRGVVDHIDVLPPNARTELALHVDADLFAFGLITERALAVSRRPAGLYEIEIPDWFRETAGQAKLDPQSLAHMEISLRKLLRTATQQASANTAR